MSQSFKTIFRMRRKIIFWVLLVFTLVVMMLLNLDGSQITTEAAPSGILSFELAGTPEKSAEIIASWDQRAQLYAAFGLGEDDKRIASADTASVALAAIQGLNLKVEAGSREQGTRSKELEAKSRKLEADNAALKQELAELKALVQTLAAKVKGGRQ